MREGKTVLDTAHELASVWGYFISRDKLKKAFRKGDTYATWIERAVSEDRKQFEKDKDKIRKMLKPIFKRPKE